MPILGGSPGRSLRRKNDYGAFAARAIEGFAFSEALPPLVVARAGNIWSEAGSRLSVSPSIVLQRTGRTSVQNLFVAAPLEKPAVRPTWIWDEAGVRLRARGSDSAHPAFTFVKNHKIGEDSLSYLSLFKPKSLFLMLATKAALAFNANVTTFFDALKSEDDHKCAEEGEELEPLVPRPSAREWLDSAVRLCWEMPREVLRHATRVTLARAAVAFWPPEAAWKHCKSLHASALRKAARLAESGRFRGSWGVARRRWAAAAASARTAAVAHRLTVATDAIVAAAATAAKAGLIAWRRRRTREFEAETAAADAAGGEPPAAPALLAWWGWMGLGPDPAVPVALFVARELAVRATVAPLSLLLAPPAAFLGSLVYAGLGTTLAVAFLADLGATLLAGSFWAWVWPLAPEAGPDPGPEHED